MSGGELLGRPDVDHGRASRSDALQQLLAADGVGVVAEVGLTRRLHIGQPVIGDSAQQREQPGDVISCQPVACTR